MLWTENLNSFAMGWPNLIKCWEIYFIFLFFRLVLSKIIIHVIHINYSHKFTSVVFLCWFNLKSAPDITEEHTTHVSLVVFVCIYYYYIWKTIKLNRKNKRNSKMVFMVFNLKLIFLSCPITNKMYNIARLFSVTETTI